jgi:hypothetical protein
MRRNNYAWTYEFLARCIRFSLFAAIAVGMLRCKFSFAIRLTGLHAAFAKDICDRN